MERTSFKIPELNTDEFFERFAGPAAFLLWDGEHIQLARVNKDYVAELGADNVAPKLDLLRLLEEPYREQYRKAAAAAKTGSVQTCESKRQVFSQCCGSTDVWISTRLRRVGETAEGCLLFASIRNITKEKQQFAAVSESDTRFRYAAEQANVYAWEYTIDTKQMRPCFRCMRDLGLPALLENYPEPAIEMGIFPQDYADMYRDWHRQLEAGAEHLESVIPLTPDRVPFHVRYTTVFDSDGKPVKAYGSATQVTETEKEREYRDIIGSLGKAYFCIYYIDLASGEYREIEDPMLGVVNSAIRQSGIAAEAFLSMSRHLVVPEQAAEVLQFTDIRTIPDRLQNQESIGIHFLGPHVGWCEGLFISAKRDENGRCTHAIWGVRSIQQEKEKEEQYKQALKKAKEAAEKHSEELDEQLGIIGSLATTFASIYYIDMASLSFVELGKSSNYVESYIGSSGDAVHAMDVMCRHIITPSQADEMREFSDLHTLDERLGDRSWISRQFESGSGRWNEATFIVAKRDDQGNCRNVIWAIRDINEMKQREMAYRKELEKARDQANAANAAKTTFLFNMSHDIRTPMNAIIGYTDLMEKHPADWEKCSGYIKKIQSSSEFLLSLINNILELARIESGAEKLDEEICDISSVQNDIVGIFQEEMQQKNLRFLQNMDVSTRYIWGDRVKLNEIFLNLLSNAYKYTPAGGTVSLSVKELPNEKLGWVTLQTTVKDTGIGMSKEYLPILFEEFSREHNSTETRIQGTGLGMPIVKRLVDLMGGTISVESELGSGTSFVVTIPSRIAEEPASKEAAPVQVDTAKFAGKRILLAEDNDLNAEIAEEILSDLGFKAERAADGIICVDMFQKAECGYYDFILMDIQMPNMDGYAATRTIRAMEDPGKNQIPIIAMTANAFESDKRDAYAAGMNGHVAKPIELPKLIEAIAAILS